MIFRFLGAQWLAAGFVGLVSMGVTVLIARRLGPDLFGVYAIALSAGAVVAVLIDGGFGKLLLRERALASPELAGFTPVLPSLAYGHALLVLSGLCLASLVVLPKHVLTTVAALMFFGALVLNQFGLTIMRADGRLVRDAGWQMGNRTLSALCVALVWWWGASQPWQMLMAQFVGAAVFGFFVTLYLRVLPSVKLRANIYRAVLPFAWIDLAYVLHFRADMVLFQFLDVVKLEAGKYGVAYRLFESVILLAAPLSLIFFRRFRLDSAKPSRVVRLMWPAVLVAALLGAACVLLAWTFGEPLVQLVYGTSYTGAGGLLVLLCCALVFLLPNGIINQAALALGLERWLAVSATAAAVLNISGNLILIPRNGVMGAALMTVLTEALLFACITMGVLYHTSRK
jgi:O-antigen/teichoic acid export membrane protein